MKRLLVFVIPFLLLFQTHSVFGIINNPDDIIEMRQQSTYDIVFPSSFIDMDGTNTDNEWNEYAEAINETVATGDGLNLTVRCQICHNSTDIFIMLDLSDSSISNAIELDSRLTERCIGLFFTTMSADKEMVLHPSVFLAMYGWSFSIINNSGEGIRLIRLFAQQPAGPQPAPNIGRTYVQIVSDHIIFEYILEKQHLSQFLKEWQPSANETMFEKMMYEEILLKFVVSDYGPEDCYMDEIFDGYYDNFTVGRYLYDFDIAVELNPYYLTPSYKSAYINVTLNHSKIPLENIPLVIIYNGNEVARTYILDLNISNSIEISMNVTFEDFQESRYLLIWMDYDNSLNETDRSNNFAYTLVECSESYLFASKEQVLTFEEISFSLTTKFSSFKYDFGDSVCISWTNEKVITHFYANSGDYSVRVKVRDDFGIEGDWISIMITVQNRPPNIVIDLSAYLVQTQQNISFSSGRTNDLDGMIIGYKWDFGDANSSELPNCTHAYAKAGMYTASFTVWDDDNTTNSTVFNIAVINRDPSADFYMSRVRTTVLEDISFTPNVHDSDGSIEGYFWDFGDGQESNKPNPTHRFATKGTFWVTLYVIDDDRVKSNIARKMVAVENIPPEGDINASTTNTLTLERINFRAICKDMDGAIGLCVWNFGDGTYGIGENVNHEYEDNGTYEVKLLVIDDDSAENETRLRIEIVNRPPTIDVICKKKATVGERVVLDASVSSDLDGRIISWRWSIDGKILNGEQMHYSFQNPGIHIVKLSVTDDDGATAEKNYEISVMETTNIEIFYWIFLTIIIIIGLIIAGLWKHQRKSKLNRPR